MRFRRRPCREACAHADNRHIGEGNRCTTERVKLEAGQRGRTVSKYEASHSAAGSRSSYVARRKVAFGPLSFPAQLAIKIMPATSASYSELYARTISPP